MGLPSIPLSRQRVAARPKRCPCPGTLLASCLFAAAPIGPSARNTRKVPGSGGSLLPAASQESPLPSSLGNATAGKSLFQFLFSGQDRVGAEWSPGLAVPGGVVPTATISSCTPRRGAGAGGHREIPTPQTSCCSQPCSPSATKPKTWVRAAGPGREGCGVLCRWRRQGHPRDPAEPAGDGASGSRHAGATASARTRGEQHLGNSSVLSSCLCCPRHFPAWKRSSCTGHLG